MCAAGRFQVFTKNQCEQYSTCAPIEVNDLATALRIPSNELVRRVQLDPQFKQNKLWCFLSDIGDEDNPQRRIALLRYDQLPAKIKDKLFY